RLLDHLLVPPLQRAIAFAKMKRIAVIVGKDLDLDMPGRSDEFLDQDAAGSESRLALAHGAFERGLEIAMFVDPSHAATAAPGRQLDQHGVTDRVGLCLREFG